MLKGLCCFFSETGTEGGYWAFQNSRFIAKNTLKPYCKKCGKYLGTQKYKNLKVIKVLCLTRDVLDNKDPLECAEGQHERDVGDEWDYRGLHILENGDRLTIYSLENQDEIAWQGIISLYPYHPFTENVFGSWIHADQNGIEREKWALFFLKEYPAKLIRIRKQ